MLIITYLKQSMFVVVTIYDKCNTGDHEGYVEEGSGDGHLSPLSSHCRHSLSGLWSIC